MYFRKYLYIISKLSPTLILGFVLTSCTGDLFEFTDSTSPTPSINITKPTTSSTFSTNSTDIRLAGTVSGASFIHVRNAATGYTVEAYVNYYDGHGSWFADMSGLTFGQNLITATADSDGSGTSTASDRITIIRPLVPAELIINGLDHNTSSTFWNDSSSYNNSHKIAFYKNGTGKSTTGNALSENAGDVVDINWTLLSPDSIEVLNCPTCSFQKITRISGSLNEESFMGQVETIGDSQEIALHSFSINNGSL